MNFLQELETVLKSDERFISQDGQLLKPRVRDAANQLDAQLIRHLMASPALREHFFKNVDDITVFDQEKFMWVVNSKEFLPDSYTSYRNKIGLSANDNDPLLHPTKSPSSGHTKTAYSKAAKTKKTRNATKSSTTKPSHPTK